MASMSPKPFPSEFSLSSSSTTLDEMEIVETRCLPNSSHLDYNTSKELQVYICIYIYIMFAHVKA